MLKFSIPSILLTSNLTLISLTTSVKSSLIPAYNNVSDKQQPSKTILFCFKKLNEIRHLKVSSCFDQNPRHFINQLLPPKSDAKSRQHLYIVQQHSPQNDSHIQSNKATRKHEDTPTIAVNNFSQIKLNQKSLSEYTNISQNNNNNASPRKDLRIKIGTPSPLSSPNKSTKQTSPFNARQEQTQSEQLHNTPSPSIQNTITSNQKQDTTKKLQPFYYFQNNDLQSVQEFICRELRSTENTKHRRSQPDTNRFKQTKCQTFSFSTPTKLREQQTIAHLNKHMIKHSLQINDQDIVTTA